MPKNVDGVERSNIPKVLYKFRTWDSEKHRRLLTHQELYFPKPKELNDPFDAQIPVRHDKRDEDELYKRILEGPWPEDKKHFTDQQRCEFAAKRTSYIRENPYSGAKLHRDILNQSVRILSLTGTREHIMLWSHYADGHKGFCAGFSTELLKKWADDIHNQDKTIIQQESIRYVKQYPDFIPTVENENFVIQQVTTKYINWDYEEEVRLLCFRFPELKSIFTYPKEALVEVVVGCEMLPLDRKRVKNILRSEYNSKPKLYTAKQILGSFKLEIARWHY